MVSGACWGLRGGDYSAERAILGMAIFEKYNARVSLMQRSPYLVAPLPPFTGQDAVF